MGIGSVLSSIFGTSSEREIKKIQPIVDEINKKYKSILAFSPEQLKTRTIELKKIVQDAGEKVWEEIKDTKLDQSQKKDKIIEAEKKALEEILPEAFAMVKETCRRLTGEEWTVAGQKIKWEMVPYDVQLIGGIVLHQNKIAEMKTGEGKTLVATLPVFLNALTGRGVHIVTVNDYLAKRDSEWMGRVYKELGLSVGCILNSMDSEERKKMYSCDITFGTNNEFGFDYLRDNMALEAEAQVQRGHFYCIVDEVDNILIDEARTPLIISGPVQSSGHAEYAKLNPAIARLVKFQNEMISSILGNISDSEENIKEKDVVAKELFIASQGAPKNRRLRKLLENTIFQKLKQNGEKEYLLLTNSKSGTAISQDEYFKDLFYWIDERQHSITLTPKGEEKLASYLNISTDELVIPDLAEEIVKIDTRKDLNEEEKQELKLQLDKSHSEASSRSHNISQLLRSHALYEKDVEYVVQDGKVMIVDEFTGRILPGRRYSDGLHQAIEAKEKVRVEAETQTYATITLQNYFRMYNKLAGMTGTAITEAAEFEDIYKLGVVAIPTNKPCVRKDHEDQVYKTRREKYNAIIKEIEDHHHKGQPILVGTITVEVSETISRMLKRKKIPHNVLNAKHHQREAEIVTQAGGLGAITIATNMAGRGTDIKLGTGVKEIGGLYIIGTERHESRRIDLQLRGRSGRQGDPGASRFFLSLEDDLMRLFNSDKIVSIMDRFGVEGQVITHSMVTKSIERAQKKVEGRNFSIRKHLLEYDNVMNQQRVIIYDRRNYSLKGGDLRDEIMMILNNYIQDCIDNYTDDREMVEAWDWNGMKNDLFTTLGIAINPQTFSDVSSIGLKEKLVEKAVNYYQQKEAILGKDQMRFLERFATLRTIDEKWKDHLYSMDHLKEGINWRAYGQKDPLLEYKGEAYKAFAELIEEIDRQALRFCFLARIGGDQRQERQAAINAIHENSSGMGMLGSSNEQGEQRNQRRTTTKPIIAEKTVGRNDPCPCGSGKKYKKCCGKLKN